MAKRFIDTNIFDDEWFCSLSKDSKLFWIYAITRCDHAGIFKLNKKLCEFQTEIKSIDTVLRELGNSMVTLSQELNTFFIPKFIKFQYPDFPKSSVKQQDSAIKLLKSHKLWDEENNTYLTVTKELPNSYDSDSDNVKGGVGEKTKKDKKKFIPPTVDEVIEYFKEKGFNEIGARKAHEHYNLADWHDTNGKPVLAWKQKMHTVWFRDEYRIVVPIKKERPPQPSKDSEWDEKNQRWFTDHQKFYGT